MSDFLVTLELMELLLAARELIVASQEERQAALEVKATLASVDPLREERATLASVDPLREERVVSGSTGSSGEASGAGESGIGGGVGAGGAAEAGGYGGEGSVDGSSGSDDSGESDSGDDSEDSGDESEEGEDCGCSTPVISTTSFAVTPAPAATANVEGSTGSGSIYARGMTPLSTPTPTPTPVQFEGAGSKTTVSGLLVVGLGLLFTLF
ncbi:hypothetical protein SLS58_009273 [Diplodia intermedia]|uniref:Uncharacterized protein n=1 Tax=Diplodia intermedia TaxID=856260 RepID=A0ABR3TDG0_9PEZI